MAATGMLSPRAALAVVFAVIAIYLVNTYYFNLEWNNQGGFLFRGAPCT